MCLVQIILKWVLYFLHITLPKRMQSHAHASFSFSVLFVPLPFSRSSRRETPESFSTPSFLVLPTCNQSLCPVSSNSESSHLFLFSILTVIFISDSFSFTWSWKPNWPFCLLFAHQSKPSHPALVRAAALSDAFRPNSLWKLLATACLIPHSAFS